MDDDTTLSHSQSQQILDGVMLSDGNLAMHGQNARFHMTLSGQGHFDWLYHIKSALLALGVMVSGIYPKRKIEYYKGEPYEHCRLDSYTSPVLTRQYVRWYHQDIKIVPDDLKLSPLVLANEFMGDGSSKWYQNNWVYAKFATHKFNQSDIDKLVRKLSEIGIKHVTLENVEPGTGLTMGNISDVRRLMDMIEPYMLPSYMYKIKRPRAIKPSTGIYVKEELYG